MPRLIEQANFVGDKTPLAILPIVEIRPPRVCFSVGIGQIVISTGTNSSRPPISLAAGKALRPIRTVKTVVTYALVYRAR